MVFLLVLYLVALAAATDRTRRPHLDESLFTAPTQLDRLHMLPENEWLFDFQAQDIYTYSPGSVVNANAATFPASKDMGMTIAMLNLGPCAMLPPHLHPRATNFVVAIEGTTNTYMIQENGAPVISQILTPGKMTIFPAASLHTMQNMGCGNATLVSALNSDDSGTQNLVNGLFNFPADIVRAAFGGKSVNVSDFPPVGTGSIIGSAECLASC